MALSNVSVEGVTVSPVVSLLDSSSPWKEKWDQLVQLGTKFMLTIRKLDQLDPLRTRFMLSDSKLDQLDQL